MMNSRGQKYFLYARKSTESEDRQINSINDQIKEVQKVAERFDLNIVEIFKESKSAKAPGRKVFNEMLSRIEKGEADAILCWKLNRLARNPLDGGKISWLLQNSIIKHIQCYDKDYKPSDNVLNMQVDLGIGNQFIIDLRGDVIRGMRDKAERGWYPLSLLPMGYRHNKDNKGVVQSVEIIKAKEQYGDVKKLWTMMLTGAYTVADIKREGDKLGLRNRNKTCYSTNCYRRLFNTEFYYGYFYWKDEDGIKKRHKGLHQAMITEQEFNKVQVLIGNRIKPKSDGVYDFTFRGLLKCGECGCSITAERKFQVRCTGCRYKFSCINRDNCPKCELDISKMTNPTIIDKVYYQCTKKRKKCSQKTITEQELITQYSKVLNNIKIDKDLFHLLLNELKESVKKKDSTKEKKMSQLKKRKSELKNRINGFTIMRAEGDISKDEFYELKQKTNNEIITLEKQINVTLEGTANWIDEVESYLEFALESTKVLLGNDNTLKRRMLSQLGSNQTLKDKTLYIIRPKAITLLKKHTSSTIVENDWLEPKNHLIK